DLRVAHRDPRGLAAPAAVDELAAEREHRADRRGGERRAVLFEACAEREWAGDDLQRLHERGKDTASIRRHGDVALDARARYRDRTSGPRRARVPLPPDRSRRARPP